MPEFAYLLGTFITEDGQIFSLQKSDEGTGS